MTTDRRRHVAAVCAAAVVILAGVITGWRVMQAPHDAVPPGLPPPARGAGTTPAPRATPLPGATPPEAGAAPLPTPSTAVSAPGHGPLAFPFDIGEEARYRVLWKGGGAVDLQAGEAVFRVEQGTASQGPGRPGFRFELTVTTSSWMSAFFDARDRFWSLTAPDLAPLVHVQELNEGRRHLTRTMTFDAGRRRVVVAEGPPETAQGGVESPWVEAARDPLGAFFEARARAVDPDARWSVPINNLGHPLTLVVRDAGLASASAEGRSQAARLLDVRLDDPGNQGAGPTARVWISTDGRRIPLAIDVAAPFGTFRVELQSYRRGRVMPLR